MKAGRFSWLLFLFPGSLYADLDPGLTQPYALQIVFHCTDHRLLTALFQEQIQRQLRDDLANTFGPLARMEIVNQHAALAEIKTRGLQSALDQWDTLSERQTLFLTLDFHEGRYLLRSRGFEGGTGIASPRVRHASTPDRASVPLLAAKMLEADFTVTGVVAKVGKEVHVALRGGQLGVERWLQPGQVLTVAQITQEGQRTKSRRLAWVLLEVLAPPRDGLCRCRLWQRYQEDNLLPRPGILGYRVVKLPTGTFAPRLKFLDETTGQPLRNQAVQVTHPGLKEPFELVSDLDGMVTVREPFAHFTLVGILSGGAVRARLPVPLVDEQPIVCRLQAKPEPEGLAGWQVRRDQWLRRIYDDLRLSADRLQEVQRLLNQSLPKALEGAKTAGLALEEEVRVLREERGELFRLAGARGVANPKQELLEGDQRLEELADRQKKVAALAGRLEQALKNADDDKALGLAQLVERARLLESQGDFDPALGLYRRVLAASPEQAEIRAHVDQLEAAWKTRDPEHAAARRYFYDTWPRLELSDLAKELSLAPTLVAVVHKAGDSLTPVKILQANLHHATQLKNRLDLLRRQDTADSRNQLKAIVPVAEALRQFHEAVSAVFAKSKS